MTFADRIKELVAKVGAEVYAALVKRKAVSVRRGDAGLGN